MLLGPSGAGKSTNIQFLLGYRFKQITNDDGLPSLAPVPELSPQHIEFVAKASSKSVTKYVSAIALDLKKIKSGI